MTQQVAVASYGVLHVRAGVSVLRTHRACLGVGCKQLRFVGFFQLPQIIPVHFLSSCKLRMFCFNFLPCNGKHPGPPSQATEFDGSQKEIYVSFNLEYEVELSPILSV